MPSRTLPGLGLTGFWDLGEDLWKDANDVNLRLLSALTQARVLSRTTALPGSPTDGDIYIVPFDAGANANAFAIRDNGAWVYVDPEEGMTAYVADANENVQFDGTDWVSLQTAAPALDGLSDVDAPTPADGDVLTWDDTAGEWVAAAPTGGSAASGTSEWGLTVAASDETTDLTTGDSKVTFFADRDGTLAEVFISVSGQSSSGDVTIDVRRNGTTIFTTPPSINASEDTSLTGTVAVLSDTDWNKGDKIEIDIDAAGTGASGLKVTFLGTSASAGTIGKHTIWIPATAMLAATTSGAASGQIETGTNKINVGVLDFDATADEYAHFHVAFPKSWNEGTVSFQAFWTTTATGTTGVAWALEGIAISDNEAADTAWGTAVVVTDDAQGATTEILVTAESAAVTIGGTPASGDICFFRVSRDVSDANDDMTEDARLVGIKLFYTIDTETDD